MAELLFVLVTVYVVYVVHTVLYSDREKKSETFAKKAKASGEIVSKKHDVTRAVKAEKQAVKKTISIKAKVKAKATATVRTVRHPETGEEAKITSNYRMTKRWIKKALVTEGLLDKVYKINEIDDVAKVKITKALDKLSKMDKYQ